MPLREQFGSASAHAGQVVFGKLTGLCKSGRLGMDRQVSIEVLSGPQLIARAFAIEGPHNAFDINGFLGKTATGGFASCFFDVPSFGQESEEAAPKPQDRLNSKVSQIMQNEKRGMAFLFLPGGRAIPPDAPQNATAIFSFCELNQDIYQLV